MDDKQSKTLKKCCGASTDVEAAATEPLQKAKRLLEDSETSVKLKKHKESDDDQLEKVKETPKEKVGEIYECCFETKDAEGNNENTIFVLGFRCSRLREDIKNALIKHFGSCGEIKRVFVPIECETGSPLGFAFINLTEDAKKALTLNGSYMEGLKLEVTMAKGRAEYGAYADFSGCERCHLALEKRQYDSFLKTHGGRLAIWDASKMTLIPK